MSIVIPKAPSREQWYPLVNDPGLHAAGVEIGARAIFQPGGPPQLRIVFRMGNREASVECVHVAVYTGPLALLPPEADLAQSSEHHPVDLPPEEHFFALNSYVEGMAALGIGGMFAAAQDAGHLPVGFNPLMQRQVMDAIAKVTPATALAFFQWVVDDAKHGEGASKDTNLLENLADIFQRVKLCIAFQEHTPPEVLTLLAGDEIVEVRRGVAWNKKLPPEVLVPLACDKDDGVRRGVAHNENTPPKILARLAGDTDMEVRWGVAHNDNTPPGVLTRLAGDKAGLVRLCVAWNKKLPREILECMAGDEDENVREGAQSSLKAKSRPI